MLWLRIGPQLHRHMGIPQGPENVPTQSLNLPSYTMPCLSRLLEFSSQMPQNTLHPVQASLQTLPPRAAHSAYVSTSSPRGAKEWIGWMVLGLAGHGIPCKSDPIG